MPDNQQAKNGSGGLFTMAFKDISSVFYKKVILADSATGADAIGEVQATPTANTLLRRLKDIADNVSNASSAAIPAGTNNIGRVGRMDGPGTSLAIDSLTTAGIDLSAPATITVTIASPGVVTWTGHGLIANDAVVFTTTGALPTGIVAGTTYYVRSTNLTANTFEISTTIGGAAVNTSGTQSGVHTGSEQFTIPAPGANKQLWVYGLALKTNGTTATAQVKGNANAVDLSGVYTLTDSDGFVLNPSGNFEMPWIKGGTNQNMTIVTGGAGTVDGSISYAIVSV